MSDAIGRPGQPLTVSVHPEHAPLMRGPSFNDALGGACPQCGAATWEPCRNGYGLVLRAGDGSPAHHADRIGAAREVPRGPALADAVADVVDIWVDLYPAGSARPGAALSDALDALARAAGRDVP
jgi:hypothetical protein